jgi:peptidoglycan/LPS O-acetylase OafA/YrhL
MLKVEIPQLTGLRFVAAFSILFLHAVVWCVPFTDTNVPNAIANWVGVYGMTLFFVLSGFVIHYNYAVLFRDNPYATSSWNFYVARFARIYPLYFFFFVFGSISDFTTNWIGYAPQKFTNYFIHHLTLTQSWVYTISIHDRLILNHGFGLAWSLSSEFFFYIAYAVFVFAILRIRKPTAGIASFAMFSIIVFGLLLAAYENFGAIQDLAKELLPRVFTIDENSGASLYRWLFYYSPYGRIWEFILGCLAAQLFLIVRNRPILWRERVSATVALGIALAYLFSFGAIYALSEVVPSPLGGAGSVGAKVVELIHFFALNFGCAVPIAIVIFYVARYKCPFSNFFAWAPMVWLGDISYSIYAVHTWTLRPLIRPPISANTVYEVDAVLRVGMGIVFTIIVSAGTYMLIEQPARRYLRARLISRNSPKSASYARSPSQYSD